MLRRATTFDVEQILNILLDAKKRMAADNLEQWNESSSYPNRQIVMNDILNNTSYVYEINNEIAGVIVINDDFYDAYPIKPNEIKSRAFHRVAVNSKYLSQGVGKKLYKFAEEEIKKQGYTVAIVDTYSKNEKMVNLITKCEYQKVGEFKLHAHLPNWIMYKKEL